MIRDKLQLGLRIHKTVSKLAALLGPGDTWLLGQEIQHQAEREVDLDRDWHFEAYEATGTEPTWGTYWDDKQSMDLIELRVGHDHPMLKSKQWELDDSLVWLQGLQEQEE